MRKGYVRQARGHTSVLSLQIGNARAKNRECILPALRRWHGRGWLCPVCGGKLSRWQRKRIDVPGMPSGMDAASLRISKLFAVHSRAGKRPDRTNRLHSMWQEYLCCEGGSDHMSAMQERHWDRIQRKHNMPKVPGRLSWNRSTGNVRALSQRTVPDVGDESRVLRTLP